MISFHFIVVPILANHSSCTHTTDSVQNWWPEPCSGNWFMVLWAQSTNLFIRVIELVARRNLVVVWARAHECSTVCATATTQLVRRVPQQQCTQHIICATALVQSLLCVPLQRYYWHEAWNYCTHISSHSSALAGTETSSAVRLWVQQCAWRACSHATGTAE